MNSDDNIPVVPKGDLLTWMKEPDIEKLGELYILLNKERFVKRITPSLEFSEGHDFSVAYLRRVLLEDHKGEWSGGRYEAGWNLGALFNSYWKNEKVPQDAVAGIKEILSDLCLLDDEALRVCVITSVLEHLFEKNDIREYFRDWKDHAALKVVYEEAVGYASEIARASTEKRAGK